MRGTERKVYLQNMYFQQGEADLLLLCAGKHICQNGAANTDFLGSFLLSAMGLISPIAVHSSMDVLFLILVFHVEVHSVCHSRTPELIFSLVVEATLIMDVCEQ